MDALGVMGCFVIYWLWAYPESVGQWLARMRNAHDDWIDEHLGGDHE